MSEEHEPHLENRKPREKYKMDAFDNHQKVPRRATLKNTLNTLATILNTLAIGVVFWLFFCDAWDMTL